MKDGIPFITRSISFYFAIPGTPLIVQILGSHNYYWTTPFAFCRQTGDDTTRLLPRYLFTYDFSKRNLKNQKLHKKKIRNKDYFFGPKKLKKKPFVFYRYAQNVTNVEALPYPETLPEFVPSHQSWAVTNALRDYAWTTKMLPSFVTIDMTDVYGDSHQHSNGTCAQIGWLSDTGYNTMDGQGNILEPGL